MSDDPRCSRQERLAEVGAAGQERILRSKAVVRGKRGADVECLYLLGAGVGSVTKNDEEEPEPFAHALRGAKRVVDPSCILNPGVLIDAG